MGEFPVDWDEIIAGLPGSSILQTREWAKIKAPVGWKPVPLLWKDTNDRPEAAALALRRSIRLGGFAAKLAVLYVPRGPVMDWSNTPLRNRVLDDLQAFARKNGAIFVKIDAEIRVGSGVPGREDCVEDPTGQAITAELTQRGWVFARDQVQFRNTVELDLSESEDAWLARMKQKTRYNVRLAQRKGVMVRRGSPKDFGMLYRMYAETSVRDGFVIRPESYYQSVWQTFFEQDICIPLVAEVDSQPVAAVMLFVFGGRAWYLHGMSREAHRDLMPNYLLQWEAMRTAKAAGANSYDLWGAPNTFDESDSMWGVFRFKEGLGGKVVRTIGAWDYPSRPLIYTLYNRFLPVILDQLRRQGKERTRQEVLA